VKPVILLTINLIIMIKSKEAIQRKYLKTLKANIISCKELKDSYLRALIRVEYKRYNNKRLDIITPEMLILKRESVIKHRNSLLNGTKRIQYNEKQKERTQIWCSKNKDKVKQICKKSKNKAKNELKASYIKSLITSPLRKKIKIKNSDVTEELINLKIKQIQIKRKLKTKQNG
jgi:hypothetical protein